jgi:hypothetical protein
MAVARNTPTAASRRLGDRGPGAGAFPTWWRPLTGSSEGYGLRNGRLSSTSLFRAPKGARFCPL